MNLGPVTGIYFQYSYTSGGVDYYDYTAVSRTSDFTFPSNSCDQTPGTLTGTVACGTSLSVTLTGKYHTQAWCNYGDGFWNYTNSITVTGTAPACPAPPPPPTPAPVWTDNTLAGFQVGVAYSNGVSASNSPAYSVSVGSLPAGISLNTSTGAVTGTPTTAATFSFSISAANAGGTITQAFSGTVAAAATFPPVWSDNTLAEFAVNQAYSDAVSATNMSSYSGVYSVSAGLLPAGISLNTSTGAVTGTPTLPAPYSFTISATNTFGTITQSFSGSVGGGVSVFDGTSWYKGPVKVYDGTTWKVATVRTYNGSAWVVTK